MRNAFIQALCEIAAQDERVWLLNGDLGYNVLEVFRDRFPDRYLNVGVAEQNMAGIAAGLALSGKRPFIYSIGNFPTLRCLEQIRNDICYHGCPVRIVAVGGGFSYGAQGYSHHAIEDLGIMRCLPGMTVVAPADPIEARLLTHAIADLPGPAYLRLGKAGEPVLHDTEPNIAIGTALECRSGDDLCLIATGAILKLALEAAGELEHLGLHARVLSVHSLKPFDRAAILRAARETGAIITVEEHSMIGGLGSAVAESLIESGVQLPPLRRLAVPDLVHNHVAGQDGMRLLIGDIKEAALALIAGAKPGQDF